MLKSPIMETLHIPLHSHLLPSLQRFLLMPTVFPSLRPTLSNLLQPVFCFCCFTEIAFVKVTNLLVSASDGDFSVLPFLQLPETFESTSSSALEVQALLDFSLLIYHCFSDLFPNFFSSAYSLKLLFLRI